MRSLLGLGATLAGGCALEPVHSSMTSTQQLDRELAGIANDPERPLASLSVLAVRAGQVAYSAQFGRQYIDLTPAGRDLAANDATLFRVASISKLVTTLGVMRLVEDGRLALDADVGAYLGFALRNPAFAQVPVTLRMLLAHTSSMRDDAGYIWDEHTSLRDVLAKQPAIWSAQHLPGAYFSYANLPWGVIATLMEKTTGERFDRLMSRLVLEPLGLAGSYDPVGLAPAALANLATLYRKRPAGESNAWNARGPWVPQVDDYSAAPPVSRAGDTYVPGTNGTLFAPQGGLRASAHDLGLVMRMLMAGGELDGRRILRRESVAAMLSPQWRHDGANGLVDYGSHRARFNAWGLGNQQFLGLSGADFGDRLVEGSPEFHAVGHLGDAYGLMGTFAFDPAAGNGIVVLVGGTSFDPETDRGAYSALARFEERIVTALYRRAVLQRRD